MVSTMKWYRVFKRVSVRGVNVEPKERVRMHDREAVYLVSGGFVERIKDTVRTRKPAGKAAGKGGKAK